MNSFKTIKSHIETQQLNSAHLPSKEQIITHLYKSIQVPLHYSQANQSDGRSIIEKLIQDSHKVNIYSQLNNVGSRKALHDTEDRIFKRVISLVLQIEELKENIASENLDIVRLENEYPRVAAKVIHKQASSMTLEEFKQLKQTNQNLADEIKRVEAEVIAPEMPQSNSQKLLKEEQLKQKLLLEQLQERKEAIHGEESGSKEKNSVLKANEQLREKIKSLELRRKKEFLSHPDVLHLKAENERLRQATLANLKLKNSSDYAREESELVSYVEEQQRQRAIFFRDLTGMKQRFNQMKSQNEQMRRIMRNASHSQIFFKESESLVNKQNNLGYSRELQSKFGEYETLIRKMQAI